MDLRNNGEVEEETNGPKLCCAVLTSEFDSDTQRNTATPCLMLLLNINFTTSPDNVEGWFILDSSSSKPVQPNGPKYLG